MARTAEMFEKPKVSRRVMMHVMDAGHGDTIESMVRWSCSKCGRDRLERSGRKHLDAETRSAVPKLQCRSTRRKAMNIHILWGFRHGEEQPEALEIMDEFSFDSNPDWLHEKYVEHEKSGEFGALRIIEFKFDGRAMLALLRPKQTAPIEATVTG